MIKDKLVGRVFTSVAKKYNLMNDCMSMGLHRLWKDRMVSMMDIKYGETILDVAGGTGDIARKIWEKRKNNKIIIADINNHMLNEGRDIIFNKIGNNNIQWVCGNAEKLPISDESVDKYSISFGIRNVSNISLALQEAYRVLVTDGKFVCMEFGKVNNIMLSELYNIYSKIIPSLGKYIAKDQDAYQYLIDSINKFPAQEIFRELIVNVGFSSVKYYNILDGVVAIYEGWKR